MEDFYEMFMKKDKRYKSVEKKIKYFVEKNFHHEVTLQEMVYLMVHINKAISSR